MTQLDSDLSLSLAKTLDPEVTKKSYKKGSFLYHMGESPSGLFLIYSGLVGLFNSSSDGKDHLFRIFGKGQWLGHRTLIAGDTYHTSAKVLEDSEIGFVSKARTSQLLIDNMDFNSAMIKKLAVELGQAEMRLAASFDKQVAQRVAEAMLYLKETYPDHKWTRNEIAYYCGSTGPTVIRTLALFQQKGFIEQTGREIEILDKKALKSFAEGP
ncbi:MAG: Crp/Fnr family transcriptional regulator [Pseudobdellovibrionaceae bacterium]|nr:Crp/Fnr family transcriptional regulator [Bdellovibrionales bacterium]USN46312.1 MAG: Crp/Fnr family transcriptional regulator [Pseudobdellovibrionaceae bacterium]